MTTTWSFLFFVIVSWLMFIAAPFLIGALLVVMALIIIGRICRHYNERTGRIPHAAHR